MSATVILTRPDGRNDTLAARLAAAGISSIVLPALRIVPSALTASQIALPVEYDIIVFVSGNSVRMYFKLLAERAPAAPWPATTLAAAVGLATAQALQDTGVIPPSQILYPDPAARGQDSEGLWALLSPSAHRYKRVLVVRGSTGREWLGRQFEAAGAVVERLALYSRVATDWTEQQADAVRNALAQPQPVIFLVTSGESVDAVIAAMRAHGLDGQWPRCRFLAIHERVASRLQSLLCVTGKRMPSMVKVCSPSDDAIFRALVQMASLSESS
ncbi:MAG TPA: uroporphyrinogen-III synthase [Candidimonas sp.]|nr:uroporphyrinogen-III synthase [Candidimonas sp.]